MSKGVRLTDSAGRRSPVIWRCSGCGALVHPAEHEQPVAWCRRCERMVTAVRDGGTDG